MSLACPVVSVLAPDEEIPFCAHTFVKAVCQCGKKYVRPIACGHEWCPDCGKEGSATHKQSFSRWWENEGKTAGLSHMEKVGYWVFTVPEEKREGFLNQMRLREATSYVVDLMKALGYDHGKCRWHWASERQPGKWAPHLNVIIEEGFLPKKKVEMMKIGWAGFFGMADWRKIDCHYEYIDPDRIGTMKLKDLEAVGYLPGGKITKSLQKRAWREVCLRKIIHLCKYITRPTWASEAGPKLQKRMRAVVAGYRNSISWGPRKWRREAVWTLKDGEDAMMHKLMQGECECGQQLVWRKCTKEENRALMGRRDLIPVGGGFFEVPAVVRGRSPNVQDLLDEIYARKKENRY